MRLIVWLEGQKQISKLDKAKQSSFLPCDLNLGVRFELKFENEEEQGEEGLDEEGMAVVARVAW